MANQDKLENKLENKLDFVTNQIGIYFSFFSVVYDHTEIYMHIHFRCRKGITPLLFKWVAGLIVDKTLQSFVDQ